MFKFFRKRRQNMITENPLNQRSRANKINRYLLYAVGEIMTVPKWIKAVLIGIVTVSFAYTWAKPEYRTMQLAVVSIILISIVSGFIWKVIPTKEEE